MGMASSMPHPGQGRSGSQGDGSGGGGMGSGGTDNAAAAAGMALGGSPYHLLDAGYGAAAGHPAAAVGPQHAAAMVGLGPPGLAHVHHHHHAGLGMGLAVPVHGLGMQHVGMVGGMGPMGHLGLGLQQDYTAAGQGAYLTIPQRGGAGGGNYPAVAAHQAGAYGAHQAAVAAAAAAAAATARAGGPGYGSLQGHGQPHQ
jgi:hypothetical protein